LRIITPFLGSADSSLPLSIPDLPSDNSARIMVSMAPTPGHHMVSTSFDLPGYRVVRTLGVVRGIVVRSRSIFGTIGAGLQTLIGGNITLLTNLCEKTRGEAFDLMLQHAGELGANAVVGARYDATEVMQGVTEVLAYGTAVVVERVA
jgi:uncharacterized protein YbjQ (UPF0145 family)